MNRWPLRYDVTHLTTDWKSFYITLNTAIAHGALPFHIEHHDKGVSLCCNEIGKHVDFYRIGADHHREALFVVVFPDDTPRYGKKYGMYQRLSSALYNAIIELTKRLVKHTVKEATHHDKRR